MIVQATFSGKISTHTWKGRRDVDGQSGVQWNPVYPVTNWPQKSGRMKGAFVRAELSGRYHEVTALTLA